MLVLLIGSCQNKPEELSYFSNMVQYINFESIKDKSKLLGFDGIILEPTNNKPYWYLSTPKNSDFNIEGFIWLEDSVIYIKAIEKENFGKIKAINQILFNFRNTDSAWTIDYNRDDSPYYLQVFKEGSFFNQHVSDTVQIFRIKKFNRLVSEPSCEFILQASLRYGFISVIYLNRRENSNYIIDFLPKPRLIIEKIETPVYLKE